MDKMVEISDNIREAENEKYEYVSGKFIRCVNSFNGFSKGETYWLEYTNDDIYVGRSDNILDKKFHITPKQIFQNFIQVVEVDGEIFKIGDVLANRHGCVFINAGFANEDKITLNSYCSLDVVEGKFHITDRRTGSWLYVNEVQKATEEQKDRLFKRMEECGYKWDSQNLCLRIK